MRRGASLPPGPAGPHRGPCSARLALAAGAVHCAPKVVVAIPARDEAQDIGAALRALREAASGAPCEVVVLANNCRDETAAIARAACGGRGARFRVRVIERRLADGRAHAGHARRLAMDAAHARCGPRDLLLTTDADATLVPGAIEALRAALGAADLACGRIATTLPQAVAEAPSIRRIDAASERYGALVQEVRFAVDRLFGIQPEGPRPHYVESGACLALTPDLYRRLGGLPDVPSSEDRALVRAAERAGARVAYAEGALAWVSARLQGRAAGGMAEAIRARMTDPDPQADQALVSVEALCAHWALAMERARGGAGAPRPAPPEARPRLRASDLEAALPRLRALVEGVVRPDLAAWRLAGHAAIAQAPPPAAGRRVA